METKTILFATPASSLFTVPVAITLRALRYRVEIIDYRRMHPLFVNSAVVAKVMQSRPAFFLTVKGEVFHPWSMLLLRKLGVKTINWYPDDALQLRTILRFARVFNVLFTFDPAIVRALQRRGFGNVSYLPFATIPLPSFRPLRPKYPTVFVGQPDKDRIALLSAIADTGLCIWGPFEHTTLAPLQQKQRIPSADVERVYRQAEIVINIHSHSFGDRRDQLTEGTNLRTFMAAGVGAFQLVEERRDLARLFVLGRELVTFRGIADLRRKVAYYLKHPQERRMIARRAYLRVKKDHTYMHRMKRMMEIVSKDVSAHGKTWQQ